MERLQAYRFVLRPSGAQERQMRRFAGSGRYVYNRALALQRERYEEGEPRLGYAALCRELTHWRRSEETSWLSDAPVHALQQSLRDLTRAYANFFEGRSSLPEFKKKGRSRSSFRYPDPTQLRLDQPNGRIFLPKLGWVKYRRSRETLGEIRNVTVSERAGRWYMSIQTRREVAVPTHPSRSAVGVDLGIVRFATLSDGSFAVPLNSFTGHERRLARAQRSLARKKEGSRNRAKARLRVARLHARTANVRLDYLHKLSHGLSQTHALVYMENLQVRSMSASARGTAESPGRRVRQKSGLNKRILDQGWGEFRRQLEYKLRWRGGSLLLVPPHYTSQTCPVIDGGCGHISSENRRTQSEFRCVVCGYSGNADHVGALNVYAAGRAVSACGGVVLSGTPVKQEPTEATHASSAA